MVHGAYTDPRDDLAMKWQIIETIKYCFAFFETNIK